MAVALCVGLAVWWWVPAPPVARVRRVFAQARPARPVEHGLIGAACAVVGSTVLIGGVEGVVLGLVAAPLVRAAVGSLQSASARQRDLMIARQLPGALDLVMAALDVGRPPGLAFALAAEASPEPLGGELATVAHRLTANSDPRDVWESLIDHPALAPVGRALRRAEASGIPASRIVASVADDLRRRRRAELTRRSRAVAVSTAAPLGACFLPAFFLIGIVPTVIGTFRTLTF